MELRGLVVMLAAGWLLLMPVAVHADGPEPARGAGPEQAKNAVVSRQVAGAPPSAAAVVETHQEQSSSAEANPLLQPGRKVRVYSLFPNEAGGFDEDPQIEGTFLSLTETSLVVRQDGHPVTIPRRVIRHIEVATTERGRHSCKQFAAGFGTDAGTAVEGQPEDALADMPPSASQEPTALPLKGQRVRVYSLFPDEDGRFDEDPDLEGRLLGEDPTSLRIRQDGRVITVPRQTVRRLEVAMGGPKPIDRRRQAVGAAIGLGPGLVAGGLAALFLGGGVSGDPDAASNAVVCAGGIIGAGLGALIAHDRRDPAWTEVPPERVRVSVLPTGRRGVRVAFAVSF